MTNTPFQNVEQKFFKRLNKVVEPLVRNGVGSPGLVPIGAIVLETTGRKSGRIYKTPLLASRLTNLILVSTVRRNSQWIKNLAETPETTIWLQGKAQPVTAYLAASGLSSTKSSTKPSPLIRFLIKRLKRISTISGFDFAILDPKVVS